MARTVFHTGAGAFGLASALLAVGALAGALLAARRGRPTLRLLVTTALAFGVFEILTGLMPDYPAFLAALVPTGLAMIVFTTTANSSTQLGTGAEMRGRVMGLYMLVFLGGTPVGAPLVGWLAATYGTRMSLIAGGFISAAAAVVIAVLLARSRGVDLRGYFRLVPQPSTTS
jgi:MFS family permease